MFCRHCGKEIDEKVEFCPFCQTKVSLKIQKKSDAPQFTYAGFWNRFVAYIIDSVILIILYLVLSFPFILGIEYLGGIGDAFAILWILLALVGWLLYYAIQESSEYQATLGKRALNIKVCNEEGDRISFGRALVRGLVKFITGFVFNPLFILIGLTAKKQGIHDFIVNTFVIVDEE